MHPNTSPTGQGQPLPTGPLPSPPHATASGSGAIVTGSGNLVTTGSGNITATTINSHATPVKKGVGFDTKILLGILLADVVFFFYGMLSYTGQNTSAETWRAFGFLAMVSVTVGMIRRWFRRRT